MNEPPIGASSHRLGERQGVFHPDLAYANLMRDLGHQQDVEYAFHSLGPTPATPMPPPSSERQTRAAAAPSVAAETDLERIVLNRIRSSAEPVTTAAVYKSLNPNLRAKRHVVEQMIDDLVESGAVLRKLTNGTHVHVAI